MANIKSWRLIKGMHFYMTLSDSFKVDKINSKNCELQLSFQTRKQLQQEKMDFICIFWWEGMYFSATDLD